MNEQLFLIDGSAFAFRAYYAIRNLTNSRGEPTNAAYGFSRVLLKLIREHDPSHLAVVFDAPGKTFRDELYAEYKATRRETPEDLLCQLPMIDEVVEACCVPLLRAPGVEADDVMGTLARRASERGLKAVLVTGDKDFLQLIDENVHVYDPNKGDDGVWYDKSHVRERFGVDPEHVVDALALIGDAADNVPGVQGVGEKTAKKLLEKYGSLEGIFEHIDELKGKQRERIEEGKDQALLSRRLVTIDTEVPLDVGVDDLARKEFDRPRMAEAFARLEFQTLLEEFMPDASVEEDLDYRTVESLEELDAVIAELREAGEFALDTETTSVDPMRAALVGLSFSVRDCQGWYAPVGHAAGEDDLAPSCDVQLDKEAALEKLRPLLEDASVGKVGHNIKYDVNVLHREGIALEGVTFDTMVASYLTDPSRLRHNLDEVSLHYLKRKLTPISDLIGTGSKAITFDRVPVEKACPYACEDADIAKRLTGKLRSLLQQRELEELYNEVELPLIGVLARMERAGISIDHAVFDELRQETEHRLAALEHEIVELAGEPFQINSPKQLQRILFDKLKLRPLRRTKTGYSTDVDVLEQLALDHPLPEKILEYRMIDKLRGTYIEALPKLINADTGRIHSSFNQAVAATGRLSSSDPNLQNIPVRSEMGRRIREGFIADPRKVESRLISADYSQIELRVLAHLSGDEALQYAFEEDKDIHQDTAARIFGVLPELVDSDMRRQAKAVNFGVVYGISPFGLAKGLGITKAEAARFIDAYFAQYPGVRAWIDRTIAEAKVSGWVTTMLKRRRYVPELNAQNTTTRRAAERVATNTPVQGTAADIIKLAMLRLDKVLGDFEARMLLQVHDELLVEAPAGQAESVAAAMKDVMENAAELSVPLKVDIGIGTSWAEAH